MQIRRGIAMALWCGAVAATVAFLAAQPVPAQEGGRNSAEKTISIDDEALTIYGKRFVLPGKREDFVKLLGEPSRESNLANTLLTWDDHGILIYIHPKSDVVHAVTIAVGKDNLDFWPKKTFSGKLLVDGVEIKGDSDMEKVNSAKKGKPFVQDKSFKNWWVITHENIAHYLENRADRGVVYVSVNVRIKS